VAAWNQALAWEATSTNARSKPPMRRALESALGLIPEVVRPDRGPVKAGRTL
jgi:hypothetical protein